jgi:hypothetical protein
MEPGSSALSGSAGASNANLSPMPANLHRSSTRQTAWGLRPPTDRQVTKAAFSAEKTLPNGSLVDAVCILAISTILEKSQFAKAQSLSRF